MYKHIIKTVFLFQNGLVAVTDQNGEQIAFFQGRKDEVMLKIKRRLENQKGIVEWKGFDFGDCLINYGKDYT
jgi:hypothetical protein